MNKNSGYIDNLDCMWSNCATTCYAFTTFDQVTKQVLKKNEMLSLVFQAGYEGCDSAINASYVFYLQ